MEIGKKIRALRTAKGITQETLALELGVSPQAVSKWETDNAAPDIQLLPDIAVYFGVTIDELFSLEEDKEFDRIQNMLWDERVVTQEECDRAERWLLRKIGEGYRPADCFRLMADMYNHRARSMHEKAAEYARKALETDPEVSGGLSELNEAMNGYVPDWNARNHHELIEVLRTFTAEHPENWRGWLWLLDNLIDDFRFDEANDAVEALAKADGTFRTPLYRGLIAWHRGDRAGAWEIWRQMERDFPEDWSMCLSLGDVMAMEGRFDEAVKCYRRGTVIQKPPRYVDGWESIAHVKEITGDFAGAIDALEEELEVLAKEWDTEIGETADGVRRNIARLRKKK